MKNFFATIKGFFASLKPIRKYLFVAFFVFTIGFLYQFPLSKVSDTILAQVRQATGLNITTQKLSFAFPIGIHAQALELRDVMLMGQVRNIKLSELKVTLSPISAIRLALKNEGTIHIHIKDKRIKLNANVGIYKDDFSIEGKLNDLQIDEQIPVPDPMNPSGMLSLAISSKLSGDFDVTSNRAALEKGDFSFIEGPLNLRLDNTNIDAPIINNLVFDQLSLSTKSSKKKMIVQSLTLDGPQLSAKGSGSIDLRPSIERSMIKLDGQIQLGKEGKRLKTFLSIAGIQLDANDTGAVKVTGPLNRMRIRTF